MELEFREYIAPLKRWWWLILLTTLVAAVSSYIATRQQVPTYRSTATLMIGSAIEDPNPSNNDFSTTRQLAGTYADLANRQSIRRATAEALGLSQLPKDIVVRQFNDTNLIDIVVTDVDPIRAQAVAAELANQLISLTPAADETDDAFVNQLLREYEDQIQSIRDQIEAKQVEIGELVSAREIADAQSELAQLESSLQDVSNLYANLRASTQSGATNTIRIVEEPSPGQPATPDSTITILTAVGIGFVLAATAAYVLEYLDDTVRTPDKVTRLTGLQTLAGIAEIPDENKLITITQPRSPTSEAFRVIRTAIQFSGHQANNEKGVLLITSAVPSEGKSTVAGNLAAVMAQAGHTVLLIDTDLRRPSQHDVFRLPNQRGLTTLLLACKEMADDEDPRPVIEDTVQATRVEGLQVLTSGPIPPNPSELLGSRTMRKLLAQLAEQYDFVVLDSPPVLSVTDAILLSAQATSGLFVVKAGKSRRSQVAEAVARLREVDAPMVGAVLNALSARSEGYQLYYYYKDPYYALDEVDASAETGGSVKEKLRKRFLGREQAA
jgi:non-specific protein-tyrosine kinase